MHDKNKDAKFGSIAKRLFRTQSKVYDAALKKQTFFATKSYHTNDRLCCL